MDRSTFLRDMMGKTYPIYACTGINHARHFTGSFYILRQLLERLSTITLEKKLISGNSRTYRTISYKFCGEIPQF